MDVQIQVKGADEVTAYNELAAWLNGNRDFRGRVTRMTSPPTDGQLGGVIDMITGARLRGCRRGLSPVTDRMAAQPTR